MLGHHFGTVKLMAWFPQLSVKPLGKNPDAVCEWSWVDNHMASLSSDQSTQVIENLVCIIFIIKGVKG